jgi:hypothetical protein
MQSARGGLESHPKRRQVICGRVTESASSLLMMWRCDTGAVQTGAPQALIATSFYRLLGLGRPKLAFAKTVTRLVLLISVQIE